MANFVRALASLPPKIPFVVHGRDPATGLDCIGFVLAVYRAAGEPIDDLDVPYGRTDVRNPTRQPLMINRLRLRFVEVKANWDELQDGDLLVMGRERDNHIAIVVDSRIHEMTPKGRMVHRSPAVWEWVTSVFRFRESNHVHR
jgi:cell wall-associated NlpC family hydrolase